MVQGEVGLLLIHVPHFCFIKCLCVIKSDMEDYSHIFSWPRNWRVEFLQYFICIKALNRFTELTSWTASGTSSSLWFIGSNRAIQTLWECQGHLVATLDFSPDVTLAPSDTNVTQYSWSHSSVKPALVKRVSEPSTMPTALWFSCSTSSREN